MSDKDLDELLRGAGGKPRGTTRSAILDELEAIYPRAVESNELDKRVARRLGVTPKTVQNARVTLTKDSLIRALPEKDEHGVVDRWMVVLANTPEVAS